jgi:plastocyanin
MAVGLLAWPAWAATHDVQLGDNWFKPETITIQPGDTVRWSYEGGSSPHNVVAADGSWQSHNFNTLGLPDSYSRTFTEPGVHKYVCTFHGGCNNNECSGMWGTVNVAGDEPDPEPTEPDPDPTEPDPDPTEPDPGPTEPDPEPTRGESSEAPGTPEPTTTDAGSPTPTVEPTVAPTSGPDDTPDVVALGSDGPGGGGRGPMLLIATLLVGVSVAGQAIFGRMASGGLDG